MNFFKINMDLRVVYNLVFIVSWNYLIISCIIKIN
jgi:hypothetical protein